MGGCLICADDEKPLSPVQKLTQEPVKLLPLPTSEQYARSLALARIEEENNEIPVENKVKVADVLAQWKQVYPQLSDEDRFKLAAECLEKESPAAKVAGECHQKRFDVNLFGYTVFSLYHNPKRSLAMSFFCGIFSIFALANILPKSNK